MATKREASSTTFVVGSPILGLERVFMGRQGATWIRSLAPSVVCSLVSISMASSYRVFRILQVFFRVVSNGFFGYFFAFSSRGAFGF